MRVRGVDGLAVIFEKVDDYELKGKVIILDRVDEDKLRKVMNEVAVYTFEKLGFEALSFTGVSSGDEGVVLEFVAYKVRLE